MEPYCEALSHTVGTSVNSATPNLKTARPRGLCGFESHPLRQLGNGVVGSPATRARRPIFGEISGCFESNRESESTSKDNTFKKRN